ncbi:unnamed protein product [Phytophthora lilii]|uniref:Unnamed protein product n=1 Tax=Phytophthora lilii TaxID=2077276 RepID=A0A9W6U275_9STRA|nr:unnamed protein product [Phytophthora lilii]
MVLLAPDAAVTAPTTSATSTASGDSTAAETTSSIALGTEKEASASPNGPSRLSDELLRQVMKQRGTRNGRLLQEALASSPYNLKVSYEVVRRHVKKLLDEEAHDPTDLDNSREADILSAAQVEKEKTIEDANEEKKSGDEEGKKEEKKARDHAEVARDLDMLADTVRSIVTDVVGSVEFSGDEENNARGSEDVDKDVPSTKTSTTTGEINVDTTTKSTPESGFFQKDDKPGDGNCSTDGNLDAVLPDAGEVFEKETELVGAPKADNCDGSLTRSASKSGAPQQKTRKQKRAEYSEETRALCVRRHETEGASYASIAKELGIPHDTVRAIVRKAKRTGSVSSAPRSGRPRKTSGIVDKVILETVKANKQCSAKAIQEELLRVFGVKISPETVRRRVLDHTKKRMHTTSEGSGEGPMRLSSGETNSTVQTTRLVVPSQVIPEPVESSAADTSVPDSVSFQDLLHEERQSVSDTIQSACTTITTTQTQFAMDTTGAPPPVIVAENALGSSTMELPVQVTAVAQPDEGSHPSKRPRRTEYSVETREQCVALHAQGQGYRRIGKALNMPHTTVRAIVGKAQRTGSVLPAKRSGRPRKTDAIVDKVILQAVKTNEKSSARIIKEQLLEVYGIRVSCETIRRRVKDQNRQCEASPATTTIPETLSYGGASSAALNRQQSLHGPETLVAAMSDSQVLQSANLIAFDENGVHL